MTTTTETIDATVAAKLADWGITYSKAALAACDAVVAICESTFDLDIDTCDSECRVCWGDDE